MALAMRSTSSRELTACIMCRSCVPDTSATLDEESSRANSRSFPKASCSLDAKPPLTRTAGFSSWTDMISDSSIILASTEWLLRMESRP